MSGVAKKLMSASGGAAGGAWDVSSLFYDPPEAFRGEISTSAEDPFSVSVAAQDTAAGDLFLKPDGTKMYVLGVNGNSVNEYNLSTPWFVNSASYSQGFSVAGQETNPSGLFFKPDGTKMYVSGNVSDAVNEYDLSTPWDISTASYLQNFVISAQEGNSTSLTFKPDGTKMYITGFSADRVQEYDLSTAWDVSSATFLQNTPAGDTVPTGVHFKSDGTRIYVSGNGSKAIDQFNLSVPWDVSSATLVSTHSLLSLNGIPTGVFLGADAAYMYVCGNSWDGVSTNARVFQFHLGSFQMSNGSGVAFKPDGLKMYSQNANTKSVDEFDLTIPWDTGTASLLQSGLTGGDGSESMPFFKPDGTKMYQTTGQLDLIREFNLSTPWDISTLTFLQSRSIGSLDTRPSGVFLKDDGTKIYFTGTSSDRVWEFDLSIPWDITSTNTYLNSLSLSPQDTAPTSPFFKDDGTKFFILGATTDDIFEYELSTPWDITTASYVQNFDLSFFDSQAGGLSWGDEGSRVFFRGGVNKSLFTFSVG